METDYLDVVVGLRQYMVCVLVLTERLNKL